LICSKVFDLTVPIELQVFVAVALARAI